MCPEIGSRRAELMSICALFAQSSGCEVVVLCAARVNAAVIIGPVNEYKS